MLRYSSRSGTLRIETSTLRLTKLSECHRVELSVVAARTLDLLDDLIAQGRAAITTAEAADALAIPQDQVRVRMHRYVQQGRVIAPARGLWVPVPPQDRVYGSLPGLEMIDLLMGHLDRDYYVGWLTRPGTLRSPRSAASAGCLTPSTCLRSPAACSGSPASIDARRSPLWTDTAHRRAPSTTVGGSPSTSRSTPTCDPHQRDNRMGPHGTMADPGPGRTGPAPVPADLPHRRRRLPRRRARLPRWHLPLQAVPTSSAPVFRRSRLRACHCRRHQQSHQGHQSHRHEPRLRRAHQDVGPAQGVPALHRRIRHHPEDQGRGQHSRTIPGEVDRPPAIRGVFELVEWPGRRPYLQPRGTGGDQDSRLLPAAQGPRPVRHVAGAE